MIATSKHVYINKLPEIVKKYTNAIHTSIKIKPIDFKPDTYNTFPIESNMKKPKLKISCHVWISKYKNIFLKGYKPNCTKEVFLIKKD